MIIDAMDILYSGKVDAFCLVSSDSDFTKLATRLREAGMLVYGIGEKKTPEHIIVTCDKLIYLEILNTSDEVYDDKSKPKKDNLFNITSDVIRLLKNSVTDAADENGWTFLGDVGSLIVKKQPNLDFINFGFEKLTPLFKSLPNLNWNSASSPMLGLS